MAAANHAQRRADTEEDVPLGLLAPEKSRIAQRAAKRQRQVPGKVFAAPLSQIEERE